MIGIFKFKKKVDSNLGIIRPANRIMRLLRLDKSFTTSIVDLVDEYQENVSEDYRREIKNAILQVEYMKTQATMMVMQNRRFY